MHRTFLTSLLLLSLVGCTSSAPMSGSSVTAVDSNTTQAPDAEAAAEPTYDVALSVPTMNCPFACWPKVKETLEGQPGVTSVTLAKQQNENAIDNPVVYLKSNGDFLTDSSIAALEEAGFKGASVGE